MLRKSSRLEKSKEEAEELPYKIGDDPSCRVSIVAERISSSGKRCQHLIILHTRFLVDHAVEYRMQAYVKKPENQKVNDPLCIGLTYLAANQGHDQPHASAPSAASAGAG